VAASELRQTRTVSLYQSHLGFFGSLLKLAHTGVTSGRVDEDLNHRSRRGFQAHTHGVKSKQYLDGRSHMVS
jgi:hypothetical protein